MFRGTGLPESLLVDCAVLQPFAAAVVAEVALFVAVEATELAFVAAQSL